ncbi:MAG: hypothetical protein QW505_05525 [Thermoplasmata archaeon]
MAMVLPGMVASPGGKMPAYSSVNNGEREVHYNYSDFFHMTFQDWNWNRSGGVTFETAGWHESDPSGIIYHDRMPTWYYLREPNYNEMIYREVYPHIWYYNPYSTQTNPDVSVGWVTYAPVRFSVWARNVTDCKTTTDAIFVPDISAFMPTDPGIPNGGWINVSYYMTYLSGTEIATMKSNLQYKNHYFYWLYGQETRPNFNDDGYWCVFMGKINYSREAAMSYLGWDGVGDVRTWFNTYDETDIEFLWLDDWTYEGSDDDNPDTSNYDIYTAYDYPMDIRILSLKLDSQNSTANTLSVLVYSVSWGMDSMIVRYLEAANVLKNAFQGWMEDMDLKVRIDEQMMNLSLSANVNYQLQAWEDDSDDVWSGGWKLENMHMDWCGNTATHDEYTSPYNRYDPDQTDWKTQSRSPSTYYMGDPSGVSYWVAPLEKDLAEYEYINVQLSTEDVLGIRPFKKAALPEYSAAEYKANLTACAYWGRMVLGKGSWPYADIAAAYNPTTKSIHLAGPIDFANETQAPGVLLHGVPAFMFDVSPVSYYTVSVTGPHTTTLQDTITVTAYNGTGAIIPSWYNGTVVLSDTDPSADPVSTSHTWQASDNGVWSTTITWATAGVQYVNATDQWFDLDVTGSSGPVPVSLIPEFSTLLIPTIGAIAIFLVFRTKRRNKTEE